MFLYTHTCFSFQIKFTGFKFTRVSFWHISNHHNDWSDLVRSVRGVKLVLVKFRSSSDLVFLFTSSRNCFKTASLASSDRFSSTEGGDRTQGASAEKHLRLIFCVTWPISQEIKCCLYFRARGKYDAGPLKFFRNVLHNPQLGSRKKSHLCPSSQFLFPQSWRHQLWHQQTNFCQSRARAPHSLVPPQRRAGNRSRWDGAPGCTWPSWDFILGAIFSQKAEGVVSLFMFFFCIISPVGVVGQPVVGRHQQVDRVDLWRLGNHDDDFRLWWWWR